MNRHVLFGIFCTFLLCGMLTGCHHVEDIPYISDAQRDSAQQILNNYSSTILPGDNLYIYVESATPESVIPFNQETNAISGVANRRAAEERLLETVSAVESQPASEELTRFSGQVSGYLVDDNGTINFPILGRIAVAGLAQDSLKHLIEQRLISGHYVDDPVVTIRLKNFRVTVVGEVVHPSQFHVIGERLTIFEALALAQDITIYGQRNNIKVLRSVNGEQQMGEIDLTSKSVFDSPYYYLQQNDIVYVEPNKERKKSAFRNPEIPHYISMAASVLHLVVTTTRTAVQIQRKGF